MVEYERVNLKLSDQQIKKLKEAVKGNNGTTLRIGDKNFNKADLLHELLLTQTQTKKLKEKVENNISTNIKLSKAQINKLIKEGGALGSIRARFLPKLIKPATSLLTNVGLPFGLLAAMSGIAIKNDIKKGGALPLIPMLLGTLDASLLTGRGMYTAGNQVQGLFRTGQGIKKNH